MVSLKIGVLGTGMVGETLATRLVGLGHQVVMGARSDANPKAADWARKMGRNARHGSFEEAAKFGDIIFVALLGAAVLGAVRSVKTAAFTGKIVIDVTNPLKYIEGQVPQLIPELINTTSIAEELQSALPHAQVIKALNTMNCAVMVDPTLVPGAHDVFLCGNDHSAKSAVTDLLKQFGWRAPIDLGPLSAARGMEMMMPMWLSLWKVTGDAAFNYKVVRKAGA